MDVHHDERMHIRVHARRTHEDGAYGFISHDHHPQPIRHKHPRMCVTACKCLADQRMKRSTKNRRRGPSEIAHTDKGRNKREVANRKPANQRNGRTHKTQKQKARDRLLEDRKIQRIAYNRKKWWTSRVRVDGEWRKEWVRLDGAKKAQKVERWHPYTSDERKAQYRKNYFIFTDAIRMIFLIPV